MWICESVQRCEACAEITPHSRRVVALPPLFGVALLAVGAWCFTLREPLWIVGVFAVFAGIFAVLWDRERFWRVACLRCRNKRVDEVRASHPRLGSTTIIDLW